MVNLNKYTSPMDPMGQEPTSQKRDRPRKWMFFQIIYFVFFDPTGPCEYKLSKM